jgi:glucose uptake protein
MEPGYIAALISALFWGSYIVPLKKHPQCNPLFFQWMNTFGIALSTLVLCLITGYTTISPWGILTGFFWIAGSSFSLIAVQKDGLSSAGPRWMGTTILISFLWGWLGFHESLNHPALAFIGIGALLFAILRISHLSSSASNASNASNNSDNSNPSNPSTPAKPSLFPYITGLFFGSYLVPLKLSGLQPLEFLPAVAVGILAGGTLVTLVFKPAVYKPIIGWGVFSGILWNIANVASFFAIKRLGLAVGYPLTQSALFISVLWGVLVFNEMPGTQKRIQLFFAALILFGGAILLAL